MKLEPAGRDLGIIMQGEEVKQTKTTTKAYIKLCIAHVYFVH